MVTIYDVAARAGVSPATVSRVFNGASVSRETERSVRKAAVELAYSPNRSARALRTQTSNVVALVVADIENPYFTALARGVEDVMRSAGYSVVLCNTDEDLEREAAYLDIAVSEHMAGVLLVPADEDSDISALVQRGKPVVAVDRLAGGRQGTEILYAQGFSLVACITGPSGAETAQRRSEGWQQAVRERFPEQDPAALLVHADYRVAGGGTAMARLLDRPQPPDAVFVANNLMAVGALQELAHRGLTPPAFGMAVFGDLPYVPLSSAGVHVVPLPARLLGATAASLLLERIRGDTSPRRTVVLHNEPDNLPRAGEPSASPVPSPNRRHPLATPSPSSTRDRL
jgi:LacI family transcriptional regulator